MTARDTAAASVVVRGLRKSFGSVKAVDGVSIEIGAGEFVALLGPSGSGKTTILMSIAGFETPDSGEILIGGRDIIPEPPHKRGIGMVFQRYALFPHMTVEQNIAFPLRMRKVPKSERGQRVERALELVRLPDYGKRRVNQLSGGQQQRVALARAIVFDPPVLLMDEPLGALDKRLREEMQIELKHIQQQLGTTVVYVTHDQSEALTMADRIAVLHEGHLQQYAVPEVVYERPTNAFVAGFVGETNFVGGNVEDTDSGLVMRMDGGHVVALPEEDGEQRAPGSSITLAIRPESMHIVGPDEAGGVPAEVVEVIYGGGSVACVLAVEEGPNVTVQEPAGEGLVRKPGDRVRIVWPQNRARVFAG